MSISTFNFQFYNYKLPSSTPAMGSSTGSSFISELEMDIDEEMANPSITSTPVLRVEPHKHMPAVTPVPALRPQLHTPCKRWSMELREKVLEMSKRNNGSDEEIVEVKPQPQEQNSTRSVSDKINFFNKLTNTFESTRNTNNRFISLLRSTRPTGIATTNSNQHQPVPPPKPKRLLPQTAGGGTAAGTPAGVTPTQRKSSLRRKPSFREEKSSRATIVRQNSNASLRPQRHTMMEDLSLVVPVRLRIAEYEQRISKSA